MADILTTGVLYQQVREALDTKLDETALSDEIITRDIYLGAAERELKARVTTWASLTGDDLSSLQAACVFLTASRLVYAVIQITSITVQGRDASFSKQAWNPDEKKAELLGMAEDEINNILTPSDDTPLKPAVFGLAHGQRGRL